MATLQINGERHELALDTRSTLLDVLRERLHLTGAPTPASSSPSPSTTSR
jgi:aerobic-type carbon monoxide dehydrogenase small subunit (CoxS/CutS family)